jgi:two-component system response regulator AtoC
MNVNRILVADDEEGVRELFKVIAEDEGYQVYLAKDGLQAVQMAKTYLPDVIVLDIRMPELDGLEVFERIQENMIDAPVIFITAFGSSDLAIDAMKKGAYNYLTKPFDVEEIRIVIRKALQLRSLTNEVAILKSNSTQTGDTSDLIGKSSVMQEVFKSIGKMAQSTAPILLLGEQGSGKEMIARKIYEASSTGVQKFYLINCYSDDSLFLTEMAKLQKDKPNTVFFRNIELLSLNSQSILLETLQAKKNWRIIASSSQDLLQMSKDGKFKEDLYYYLNVIPLEVPSLRKRKEDLPELAQYFLRKYSMRYGKVLNGFTKDAMALIQSYEWPGNLNEMENAIAHGAINTTGSLLSRSDLPISMQEKKNEDKGGKSKTYYAGMSLSEAVRQFEKELIVEVLQINHGNKTKTAELLGISRRSLFNKMRDYDLLKDNEIEIN